MTKSKPTYTQLKDVDSDIETRASTPSHPAEKDILYTKAENKAQLTREEAENIYHREATATKSTVFKTLFEHIKYIIKQENLYRQEKTINGLYEPQSLNMLLEKLENSQSHNDIKQIIRLHLNEQELIAAKESIATTALWSDIRAELNAKIGFQPEIKRDMEIAGQLIKKEQYSFFSKPKESTISTGRDPYAVKRKSEQHQVIEKRIASLIDSQKISEEDNLISEPGNTPTN
ncbi:MAG: hypothetical protein Q8R83_04460 [Legionellaceae bacterium]|nr:hypothetical protein [Legionellaceae bacterium]